MLTRRDLCPTRFCLLIEPWRCSQNRLTIARVWAAAVLRADACLVRVFLDFGTRQARTGILPQELRRNIPSGMPHLLLCANPELAALFQCYTRVGKT